MMPVALVGLPGVGKSTVGRRLARLLDRPFVDTDRLVESVVGCSIAEYFEREGEARFRVVESEVLHGLFPARHPDGFMSPVIACGGGIVLAPDNRLLLAQRATTVYMAAAPSSLLGRLRRDTRRPLLRGVDLELKLERLRAEREPLFREVASLVVEVRGAGTGHLADTIAAGLEPSRT